MRRDPQVVHIAHRVRLHCGGTSVRLTPRWFFGCAVRCICLGTGRTQLVPSSHASIGTGWTYMASSFCTILYPKTLPHVREHPYAGFKSVPFLNFFCARIQPTGSRARGKPRPVDEAHWTEDINKLAHVLRVDGDAAARQQGWADLWDRLGEEGILWVSKCQGEWNVIYAVDTPIVFRSLSEQGTGSTDPGILSWAGDYTLAFDPTALLVHPYVTCF